MRCGFAECLWLTRVGTQAKPSSGNDFGRRLGGDPRDGSMRPFLPNAVASAQGARIRPLLACLACLADLHESVKSGRPPLYKTCTPHVRDMYKPCPGPALGPVCHLPSRVYATTPARAFAPGAEASNRKMLCPCGQHSADHCGGGASWGGGGPSPGGGPPGPPRPPMPGPPGPRGPRPHGGRNSSGVSLPSPFLSSVFRAAGAFASSVSSITPS
jgi:hypothetical protein